MPNINIDDAYILNETGAQVDKVTGLFTKDEDTTSGEKAFAQLNIGTAGSNRNLLDNPFFTVNQRSAGSTSDGYPADRWLKAGNTAATATATADGLVIALNGSGYCDLRNRYSEAEIITPNLGKTATISAMLADGTVFSDQIVLNTTQQNRYLNSGKIRFDLSVSGGVYLVRLVLYDDMTIRAVKLELGSVSTLANDAPPEYDTALWHCQRARWQNTGSYIMTASAVSATQAIAVMPLPNVLFKTPTLEQQGAFVLADRVNASIAVTTIQLLSSDLQTCALLITTGGGLTRGVTYGLALNGTGRLALNADL